MPARGSGPPPGRSVRAIACAATYLSQVPGASVAVDDLVATRRKGPLVVDHAWRDLLGALARRTVVRDQHGNPGQRNRDQQQRDGDPKVVIQHCRRDEQRDTHVQRDDVALATGVELVVVGRFRLGDDRRFRPSRGRRHFRQRRLGHAMLRSRKMPGLLRARAGTSECRGGSLHPYFTVLRSAALIGAAKLCTTAAVVRRYGGQWAASCLAAALAAFLLARTASSESSSTTSATDRCAP